MNSAVIVREESSKLRSTQTHTCAAGFGCVRCSRIRVGCTARRAFDSSVPLPLGGPAGVVRRNVHQIAVHVSHTRNVEIHPCKNHFKTERGQTQVVGDTGQRCEAAQSPERSSSRSKDVPSGDYHPARAADDAGPPELHLVG